MKIAPFGSLSPPRERVRVRGPDPTAIFIPRGELCNCSWPIPAKAGIQCLRLIIAGARWNDEVNGLAASDVAPLLRNARQWIPASAGMTMVTVIPDLVRNPESSTATGGRWIEKNTSLPRYRQQRHSFCRVPSPTAPAPWTKRTEDVRGTSGVPYLPARTGFPLVLPKEKGD